MAAATGTGRARPVHPLHAFLVAGTVPLFLGALLADLAYGSTAEIQWTNFAAWLIVGAMVFAGLALPWALVDWLRSRPRRGRALLGLLLLLAAFALGLVDAIVHARDAFAVMPAAPILSAIVTAIVLVAAFLAFSGLRPGERT